MFAKRYAGTAFAVPEHNKARFGRKSCAKMYNADITMLVKTFAFL